jgi:hypothetical protein
LSTTVEFSLKRTIFRGAQKLFRKRNKQNQFSTQRENYVVIELNHPNIAGDLHILSSLSNGFKINIDKRTLKKQNGDYDWENNAFQSEELKYLKAIIWFNLGDYHSRKYIYNPLFKTD